MLIKDITKELNPTYNRIYNNTGLEQLEFPIPRCIKPIEQSLLIPLGVNK